MTNTTTNGTVKDYLFAYALYSETNRVVGYSIAYALIAIVALIGNFMVMMVVFMNKNMHTATNVLLVNLSLSDILFVLFAVPGLLQVQICNDRWVLGYVLAVVQQITTVLCAASSVFTMMAIALERYFAVVHPLKTMARKKKWTVVVAIVVIWSSAIAMSVPQAIYTVLISRRIAVLKDGAITSERRTIFFVGSKTDKASKALAMTYFVFLNVIPILFLGFFYACIVWKLWNPDRNLTRQAADSSKSFVARARRKTTTMLIVVLVVFFLLMFPYNLLNIVVTFVGAPPLNKDAARNANSVLQAFFVLNSATNPIIYNFLSEKFRVGFRNIFSCRIGKSTRVGASTSITDGETILA